MKQLHLASLKLLILDRVIGLLRKITRFNKAHMYRKGVQA